MRKSTFPLKYENVGIPLPSKKLDTMEKKRLIFLTLAMIHPTCLHLCTKLLSKARKGDAIHPEKSALFTIY